MNTETCATYHLTRAVDKRFDRAGAGPSGAAGGAGGTGCTAHLAHFAHFAHFFSEKGVERTRIFFFSQKKSQPPGDFDPPKGAQSLQGAPGAPRRVPPPRSTHPTAGLRHRPDVRYPTRRGAVRGAETHPVTPDTPGARGGCAGASVVAVGSQGCILRSAHGHRPEVRVPRYAPVPA